MGPALDHSEASRAVRGGTAALPSAVKKEVPLVRNECRRVARYRPVSEPRGGGAGICPARLVAAGAAGVTARV
ncbi:MAG: hypothetical protein JW940_37185, partial [Polyangiaceae bacterium]|nr:hypothetical protein [Polyangiaceae bacterium]